jgi:hypothetical protein
MMDEKTDWASLQYRTVACRLTLRETYLGMSLKTEVAALRGAVVHLTPLWQCEDDERYPGEWALGDARGHDALGEAGISWIASGDVTVLNEAGGQ